MHEKWGHKSINRNVAKLRPKAKKGRRAASLLLTELFQYVMPLFSPPTQVTVLTVIIIIFERNILGEKVDLFVILSDPFRTSHFELGLNF